MDTQTLQRKIGEGPVLLDGATGSCLRAAGMPRDAVTELWVLEHPAALEKLQLAYRQAGCRILLAPTLQAQELVLGPLGYDVEKTNARLVRLTRSFAGQECLVAGNLGPLAGSMDSWNEARSDRMTEIYRCQIGGLLEGGVDLIMAETLLYPLEAACIARAAELEGSQTAVCYTFTMQPDGTLFSGRGGRSNPAGIGASRCGGGGVQLCCGRAVSGVADGQTAPVCPWPADFQAQCRQSHHRAGRHGALSHGHCGICPVSAGGAANGRDPVGWMLRNRSNVSGCPGAALAQRENPRKEFWLG